MEKPSLLGDSSDSDVELGINEEYAKKYDQWRQQEEVQKLKDKYGDVSDLSTSSESEDDDEGPKVDESFYKALSLVKSGDSKMYDIDNTVLSESKEKPKKSKEKKPKPLFLKDYEMKVALETGGQFSDYEDEHIPPKKIGYDEEQEQIRKSFTGFDLSDDGDDDDDILNVRTTAKVEEEKPQEDYISYLKGEAPKKEQAGKKDLTFLRNYWNDPKLNEDEKFLRDYFLNAKYEDKDKSETVPTYEDITNDVDAESDEEAAAEFEHKYNFRFEEPDSEFIKRYPRTMKDSLRKTDQRRKMKREERAERKKLEKTQRREEIKFLKSLKRKEIEEKLNLIKETLDDENIALEDADIEGDFDPAEHDKKMKKLFNDEYYDVPEEEKPSFPEDEDLDFENWDDWAGNDDAENNNGTNDEGPHCEDPGFNMDADREDPKLAFQKEMIGASRLRSKKKKKSLFASVIGRKKPAFDPSDKPFEQYVNEYYQLDCEDFIGDLPTRFRYREVVPNDFGLSVDEILTAEDRELNQWCSLKRICQNRTNCEEMYDVQAYQKKAQDDLKKKKIFTTLYNESENVNVEKKTKKQKKAEKLNENSDDALETKVSSKEATTDSTLHASGESQVFVHNSDSEIKKRKKKKKKNKKVSFNDNSDKSSQGMSHVPDVSSSSAQNNTGDNPSSKKRKRVEEQSDAAEENALHDAAAVGQKKKKKRKHNKDGAGGFHAQNPSGGNNQFSESFHKRNQSKHKPHETADKRLLLSDKRLEAYGINPKKFKNKIRFANK